MYEVKAYVRREMLDGVVDALSAIPGIPGIAVVELREYGHAVASGSLVKTQMAKLEIDVAEAQVQLVVDTIVSHARTQEGHPGDGKVFVSPLSSAIRIADGVQGEAALSR